MASKAAKLEINVDGDEPFKPGDRINGHVALTTTKPLKLEHDCRMEIKFEGRSWNNEPGGRSESIEHANESISLLGPICEGKFLQPGTQRFEFSFEIPENSNSSIVVSRFGVTNFNITTIFRGRNEDVMASTKRDLTVLAPSHLLDASVDRKADPPSSKETTVCFDFPHNTSEPSQVRYPRLKPKQLSKRIFNPGEIIPISGTFSSGIDLPIKVKASVVATGKVKAHKWYASQNVDVSESTEVLLTPLESPVLVSEAEVVNFRLPATIPTESSLFEPLRNQRRLVITMEHIGKGWLAGMQLTFPIQVEN